MNIKRFKQEQDWVESILSDMNMQIENTLLEKARVNVLLSGGSTPGPVYEGMYQQIPNFSKLQIGLVDERFVPTNSDQSNERLLRVCFKNIDKQLLSIEGMVRDTADERVNLSLLRKAYKPFIDQTDIVVLGMGGDGHTASIFPADPASDEVRQNGKTGVFITKAPVEPVKRITCSTEMICNSKQIYLLISGAEKWKVLHDFSKELPIHDIVGNRNDIKIYYLEKA